MARARRVDGNQSEIVCALRTAGASVQILSSVGKGCPDLLVAYRDRWHVLELKDGAKVPSKQTLTEDEERWHDEFGQQAPVHICNSVEAALRIIGAMN